MLFSMTQSTLSLELNKRWCYLLYLLVSSTFQLNIKLCKLLLFFIMEIQLSCRHRKGTLSKLKCNKHSYIKWNNEFSKRIAARMKRRNKTNEICKWRICSNQSDRVNMWICLCIDFLFYWMSWLELLLLLLSIAPTDVLFLVHVDVAK